METETEKLGRIVEIYEDKAVIQVFEGTESMSLTIPIPADRTSNGDRTFRGNPRTYL